MSASVLLLRFCLQGVYLSVCSVLDLSCYIRRSAAVELRTVQNYCR